MKNYCLSPICLVYCVLIPSCMCGVYKVKSRGDLILACSSQADYERYVFSHVWPFETKAAIYWLDLILADIITKPGIASRSPWRADIWSFWVYILSDSVIWWVPFVSISLCTLYFRLFVIDSQPLSTITWSSTINSTCNTTLLSPSLFLVPSGYMVRYSPARTRVPCVVFTIGGVTARLIRR